MAMSQDGRNWARIEGAHHTGALFDAGKQGEVDSTFAAGPQVRGASHAFTVTLPFRVSPASQAAMVETG